MCAPADSAKASDIRLIDSAVPAAISDEPVDCSFSETNPTHYLIGNSSLQFWSTVVEGKGNGISKREAKQELSKFSKKKPL